jgi:hypothetical protein
VRLRDGFVVGAFFGVVGGRGLAVDYLAVPERIDAYAADVLRVVPVNDFAEGVW